MVAVVVVISSYSWRLCALLDTDKQIRQKNKINKQNEQEYNQIEKCNICKNKIAIEKVLLKKYIFFKCLLNF